MSSTILYPFKKLLAEKPVIFLYNINLEYFVLEKESYGVYKLYITKTL